MSSVVSIDNTHIPVEMIELILSNLPVKSAVRFQSVCKQWRAIISDPRFFKMHRVQRSKLSENTHLTWAVDGGWVSEQRWIYLVKLKEDGKFGSRAAMAMPQRSFIFPECSCDGIFLIVSKDLRHYTLWNPSIQKNVEIRTDIINLDQVLLHQLYHDPTTDDYKIVSVSYRRYAVYSCENNSWSLKQLPCNIYEVMNDLVERGASVDGCFYGISNRDDDDGQVACFDARNGSLDKFPVPEEVRGRNNLHVKVEAVLGRLCLFSREEDSWRFCLWEMEKKNINGSFEKKWRKLKVKIGIKKDEDLSCFMDEDDVIVRVMGLGHTIYNRHRKKLQTFKFDLKCVTQFFPFEENLYMPQVL